MFCSAFRLHSVMLPCFKRIGLLHVACHASGIWKLCSRDGDSCGGEDLGLESCIGGDCNGLGGGVVWGLAAGAPGHGACRLGGPEDRPTGCPTGGCRPISDVLL